MKLYIVGLLIAFLLGAALVWKFRAPETRLQIIEKIVNTNDIKTVTKTKTAPDGTTETVVETIDRSTRISDSSLQLEKAPRHSYLLGFTIGSKIRNVDPVYGLWGSARMIGPVFAGAYVKMNGELGVIAAFEF